MTRDKSVALYTDGACSKNPGLGGWGVVISVGAQGQKRELSGSDPHTTNNRMELMAAIQGLQAISEDSSLTTSVTLYTDSRYVKDGITLWVKNWKTSAWRTSENKPVKNQDLWQHLDTLTQKISVVWEWVPGHAGVAGNVRADQLARHAIVSLMMKEPEETEGGKS